MTTDAELADELEQRVEQVVDGEFELGLMIRVNSELPRIISALRRQPSSDLAQSQARVAELEKVAKFLLGEEALLGFWFGECPEGQPIFWWRKHLREALKSRP